MFPYYDFYHQDESYIAIENWCESLSVEQHQHEYYELFFIDKGSCTHRYNGQETLLIPGDSFLVPPHHVHGFAVHSLASIYNCQFYLSELEDRLHAILSEYEKREPADFPLLAAESHQPANINQQRIIHFAPHERMFVLSILTNMMEEQNRQQDYYSDVKQKYLETSLILFKRASNQQFKNYYHQPKRNQAMITEVLASIEAGIAEDIDFGELAVQKNLSPNHFRKLFKDFTGLSPVVYLNRLRIVKACDLLRDTDQSMSDIAASVGIYDQNYFSRLFKQVMGCSPKQYIAK